MSQILVVDAEPVIRKLVSSILERGGYEVTAVGSLKTAMAELAEQQPLLVITNVTLPQISGHDAMKEIKRLYPDTPVLMCSGLPDTELIDEWRGEDGFDVFPKPFKGEQLLAKVREMLDGDSAQPARLRAPGHDHAIQKQQND